MKLIDDQSIKNLFRRQKALIFGPCWWGTYPLGVFTQLEKLDFTGKKVMALMTHEGIIVTPLAVDEFNGPRGDFYKNMFAKCPAGRPGTADEVANATELLMSDKGAFTHPANLYCTLTNAEEENWRRTCIRRDSM